MIMKKDGADHRGHTKQRHSAQSGKNQGRLLRDGSAWMPGQFKPESQAGTRMARIISSKKSPSTQGPSGSSLRSRKGRGIVAEEGLEQKMLQRPGHKGPRETPTQRHTRT